MAFKTKGRLQQLTASMGAGKAIDVNGLMDVTTATGSIAAADFSSVMSYMAAAIGKINGGASWTSRARGVVGTQTGDFTIDSAADIILDADGADVSLKDGGTQFIKFTNNSGDCEIRNGAADGDIKFLDTGGNEVFRMDGGEESLLMASSKKIMLGAAEEYIYGDGTDIHFGVGANGDINLPSAIGLTFGNDGEKIEGDGTDMTIDSSNDLTTTAGNNLIFDAQGTTAGDGFQISLGTDTTATKFQIKNNTGAEKFSVDATGTVTIANDLIVQGTTTTISSSNLIVQDSIIGLGVSGSANNDDDWNNVGDRGIIFARGADKADLPGFWWNGTKFQLGLSATAPISQSFGAVSAYSTLTVTKLELDGTGDYIDIDTDMKLVSTNDIVLDPTGGDVKADGHVLPNTDNTYDLGSSGTEWRNIYLQGDILFADAGEIDVASGDLTLDVAGKIILDADTQDKDAGIIFKDNGAEFGSIWSSTGESYMVISGSGNTVVVSGSVDADNGSYIFHVIGGEASSATLALIADQGDDNADYWMLKSSTDNNGFSISQFDGANMDVMFEIASGGGGMEIGDVGAAQNFNLDFKASGNSGRIQWTQASDYFTFSDDILMSTTEKIQFTDTGVYIHSSENGQLDLVTDGTMVDSIYLNAAAGGVKILGGKDDAASVHLSGYGLTYTGGDQNDSHYFENSPLKLEEISAPTSTNDKLYNINGALYWDGYEIASGSGSSSASRTVYNVSSSISAGTKVAVEADVSGISIGSRYNLVDVFVNGQIMVSGSETARSAGSVDYMLYDEAAGAGGQAASADLKFAFAVENGDVVQVVVR